jgi:acyl-CoA thioester hydrolase
MVVRERVRWSDVDAAGIVCYGSFLRFFEVGEGELFRAAGLPHAAVDAEGVWLVRRRVECDFLRPVRLDDELEVHTRVDELGGSSLALAFEIRRGGETAVTGRYVLVSVDRGEMRPVPLPPRIRVALAPVRAVARTGA